MCIMCMYVYLSLSLYIYIYTHIHIIHTYIYICLTLRVQGWHYLSVFYLSSLFNKYVDPCPGLHNSVYTIRLCSHAYLV